MPLENRRTQPEAKDVNDASLYADVIQPIESAVKGYIGRKYGAYVEADDIVQEAVIQYFEAKDKVSNPRAYLFATARNLAVNRMRKEKGVVWERFDHREDLEMFDEMMGADELASRKNEIEILREAVRSLPKRCQKIFILRKFKELSYREISRQLGISKHAISTQISIGLSKCARYMEKHGKD